MNISKRIEELKWFSAARDLTHEELYWLFEQAERLASIENSWIRIEENNEPSDELFNEVHDILSNIEN